MSFNNKHMNEDLNFNDVQLSEPNVLYSYYEKMLLDVFKRHYHFCDLSICVSSDKTKMIILKNKISGTNTNDTLLYLIPKEKGDETVYNVKILKFKSFTSKLKYIDLCEIVDMLVDLCGVIPINRCIMHLPSNEAPGMDFYLEGGKLKWENIKFLVRHKIKIVFDNYMFIVNNANIERYGEFNWKHYEHKSKKGKEDSILTDFGSIFYPLVGDVGREYIKLNRTKLDESLDFNSVNDEQEPSYLKAMQNIPVQSIFKKYIKNDNLYVVSNANSIFVKLGTPGVNVKTLVYITPAGKNTSGHDMLDVKFSKYYALMFNQIQNGDDHARNFTFDSTTTLWIIYDLLKLFGFQSIKHVYIKMPDKYFYSVEMGTISAREFEDKLWDIFETNHVKFSYPDGDKYTYNIRICDLFYVQGKYDTDVFSDRLLELLKRTLENQPFIITHDTSVNESINFNDIKQESDLSITKPENIICQTLQSKMPHGHSKEVSVHVFDYGDVKQYWVLINNERLATLICVEGDEENCTLYINWGFSIKNSKIWDSNITKIFNFLLNIPFNTIRSVVFEGILSKLPIHLDLNILDFDTLQEKHTVVRWKPGFDLHNIDNFMDKHGKSMQETIKMLNTVFESYKFNDDDRLLP